MLDVVTIKTLTDPQDGRLHDLIRIYLESFPANERKPISCFSEMLQRSDYAIAVAMLGTTVVGFASVFVPVASTSAALLEYLAVDSFANGKGIGTALVRRAVQLAGHRPLLLEVESASDPQADRRRRFYQRLGAQRILNLRYLLPLPGAPSMDLFVLQPSNSVTVDHLQLWLTQIYLAVYACSPHDSRLLAMFDKIERPIELESNPKFKSLLNHPQT